jgi:hypothetical protein
MVEMRHSHGKISFLRVHDVRTGFGPPSDLLDGECVIKLQGDASPDQAYGFTLRNDDNSIAHKAMFDLIRDFYLNDREVVIEYFIEPGKKNGRIFRVQTSD